MMKNGLAKYKAGLAIIGIFTLAMLILVIAQASGTKQDTNTYNRASDIANTLNDYISSNNVVPESLSEAGVGAIPSTITYHKVSGSTFNFCVDYKTTSSDFDPTDVETSLLTGSLSGDGSSGSENSTLYKIAATIKVKTAKQSHLILTTQAIAQTYLVLIIPNFAPNPKVLMTRAQLINKRLQKCHLIKY
jgi:type II secretory pathway pseudopilin PulG